MKINYNIKEGKYLIITEDNCHVGNLIICIQDTLDNKKGDIIKVEENIRYWKPPSKISFRSNNTITILTIGGDYLNKHFRLYQ